MKKIRSLNEIIEFNGSFKTAINLCLSLNKTEKVLGYIPTKSSVNFMGDYMKSVIENKEQATLLVGPYGKGKSHLLLVLLAILSMDRTEENDVIVNTLVTKVKSVDEIGVNVANYIELLWKGKKFLPVIITDSTGDLNQAFLYGLNEALKRKNLTEISPETYYSIAMERIEDWEKNYTDTYTVFENEITQKGSTIARLKAELKLCSKEAMDLFKLVYPRVTAGTPFNPMAVSDVLPLYKSVSEKLVEDYEYSGIYIVFDEFSKFIESQDGTAVGSNMKLIQDICELATESQHAQVFFTMVAHKSIKEYGKYLSAEIINSFTGIEGRIIEKYFITSSKNNYELIKNAIVKKSSLLNELSHYEGMLGEQAVKNYYQLPAFKSNFTKIDFENTVLRGCYPLNPIASYLLLNISEKVAQNERTLFTFISNDEPHSMARFVREHTEEQEWNIGADLIYDYFEALFKKEVVNEFVHNIWLSAEYVLDKCKSIDQIKIVKALAIILIVNKEDEISADEKYLSLCVNANDSVQSIRELIDSQLIYKKSATGAYAFKTRAGSELKAEIKKQREIKGDNVNYSKILATVTGKYYVIPRKYNTLYSMTRFFTNEFMNVEDFLNISSSDAILNDLKGDGKVITLYSFVCIKQEQVKRHIEELAETRIAVICPKQGIKFQKQLKDFEIIQELRENQSFTDNNEILKKELPLMLDDLTTELEIELSAIYEEDADTRVLYFDGEKVHNVKSGNEEIAVNECCENVYFKTAIINNEMVNRSAIGTAQTKKARINIIQAILDHDDDEKFYEGSNQEATVYRSLFCQTGIDTDTQSDVINEVLDKYNSFIDSCSDIKQSFSKLVDELTAPPYGMRKGVIPIYLAYVLANRREDIIVYFLDKEVQITSDIIVNMCEQANDYTILVSKEDFQKEKYISELNVLFRVEDNRNLSANRIKDILICMQRWFRALPQVSRNLVEIDRYVSSEKDAMAMKSIKKALQKVEFNPFELLFVTFPEDFGADSLEKTYEIIDDCKTYYDDYLDWLQSEVSNVVYEIWGGRRKMDLYHTLTEWYVKQSIRSKQGLYSGRMTNVMSCIETLNVYNDSEVSIKMAKAVSDVYLENWNIGSIEEFKTELGNTKTEIESIKDEYSTGELALSFTGRNGEQINKLYSHADEGTGSVLRNIIEDTLEEYDDLSVNDRVSILLEMIEKIIR